MGFFFEIRDGDVYEAEYEANISLIVLFHSNRFSSSSIELASNFFRKRKWVRNEHDRVGDRKRERERMGQGRLNDEHYGRETQKERERGRDRRAKRKAFSSFLPSFPCFTFFSLSVCLSRSLSYHSRLYALQLFLFNQSFNFRSISRHLISWHLDHINVVVIIFIIHCVYTWRDWCEETKLESLFTINNINIIIIMIRAKRRWSQAKQHV